MMYQCGRCGLTRASSQAMGLAMPQCQCPWEFTPPIPKPTREWVGLTDEEVESYWDWEDFQCGCGQGTLFEMVRAIEAKLKEKNT